MRRVYDFLCRLKENNNREWFNAHKAGYLHVQAIFNDFAAALIKKIEQWDSDISDSALALKDCTYRIYRDIRFSKDKSPYKTHMGAYICKGGKKSQYAGYYFHIEPVWEEGNGFLGGSLLAAGLYRPDPKIVKSIRDEIYVNGDTFLDAVALAKGFNLDGDVLKKLPQGFNDVRQEWNELIRQKEFGLFMPIGEKFLFGGNDRLLEYVNGRFKSCCRYNKLINMAVDYALEEY